MKLLTLLIPFSLIFIACNQNRPKENKPDKFYFERFEDGSYRDGDTLEKLSVHKLNDAEILTFSFNYNEEGHQVRIYNNLHTAPIDGEHTIYELDDFGAIFALSNSWNSYVRAHSTNDSIEKLFTVAIDQCLSRISVNPLVNNHESKTITFKEIPEVQ